MKRKNALQKFIDDMEKEISEMDKTYFELYGHGMSPVTEAILEAVENSIDGSVLLSRIEGVNKIGDSSFAVSYLSSKGYDVSYSLSSNFINERIFVKVNKNFIRDIATYKALKGL